MPYTLFYMRRHKTINRYLAFFLIFATLLSCRSEDDFSVDPPVGSNIDSDSQVANLMLNVSLNDGSVDDIIDSANCLEILLPVNIDIGDSSYIIDEVSDYTIVENTLEESNLDTDAIVISFPITVMLPNFSTVQVNSDDELEDLGATCLGAFEDDDDIECIDFKYPMTASAFDITNELISTITIINDSELYAFVNSLSNFSAVTLNFPITVIFDDVVFEDVNSLSELSDAIIASNESCDEDDGNAGGGNCNNCNSNALVSLLTGCEIWEVNKLRIGNSNLQNDYDNFEFTFLENGNIKIHIEGVEVAGTYQVTEQDTITYAEIIVEDYPIFNNKWRLHVIQGSDNNPKVDLRLNGDRLRFQSDCDDD